MFNIGLLQNYLHKTRNNKKLNIKINHVESEKRLYSSLRNNNQAVASIVSSRNTNYLREFDIKIVQTINSLYAETSIGVGKENIEFKTILNKIIQNIPKEEIERIRKKKYESTNPFSLNSQEIKWIKNNTVNIINQNNMPIFLSDKNHRLDGLTGDVLNIISKKTGIHLHSMEKDGDELTMLNNKVINLMSAVPYDKKKALKKRYVGPYYLKKNYLYFNENKKYIKKLDDLNNKTLIILKNKEQE